MWLKATFFITRLIFEVQAPPHTLKLNVPSLNRNMHIVNISPQDRLTSGVNKRLASESSYVMISGI